MMIISGMDFSGTPNIGNNEYMRLVFMSKEKLDSVINHIGIEQYCRNVNKNNTTRSMTASRLNLNDPDILSICVKLEKDRIIKQLKEHMLKNNKNFKKIKSITRTTIC